MVGFGLKTVTNARKGARAAIYFADINGKEREDYFVSLVRYSILPI